MFKVKAPCKMKCITLIALLVVVSCEVKEEDDVLVVTQANWDEVVTSDATVLVEFCKNNFSTLIYLILMFGGGRTTRVRIPNLPIFLSFTTPFAVVAPFWKFNWSFW